MTTMTTVLSALRFTIGRLRPATVRRRRETRGVLAAVAVAATLMVNSSPASADFETELKNQNTRRCLNWFQNGNTYNRYVGAGRCRVFYSHWGVHPWGDGTAEVKAFTATFRACLDDSFAFGLRMFSCNASIYQRWYRTSVGSGYVTYQNRATGRCLDDSYVYGPRTIQCNRLSYQNWLEGIF